MLTYSPPLVEADVERELDDQRHELFQNEVREFRHEGREEFCAVRFFVGFPAARGLDFPQVGVRAMPGVILKDISNIIVVGWDRSAAAKENAPETVVSTIDCHLDRSHR